MAVEIEVGVMLMDQPLMPLERKDEEEVRVLQSRQSGLTRGRRINLVPRML